MRNFSGNGKFLNQAKNPVLIGLWGDLFNVRDFLEICFGDLAVYGNLSCRETLFL